MKHKVLAICARFQLFLLDLGQKMGKNIVLINNYLFKVLLNVDNMS